MIQQWLIKILLAPFALLYGLTVLVRNGLYQIGFFKSIRFSFPVISIGNLSVGGTGKTPHIEYFIQHLQEYVRIGVLSRGYGRNTRGYRLVQTNDHAELSGDEPVQIKRKFPDTAVAVSENRALGIPQLLKTNPEVQLILLDDAYQHRAIRPALSILLTDYNRPYYQDFLLPVGRLREWRGGARRADAIVVTKCPLTLTPYPWKNPGQNPATSIAKSVFLNPGVWSAVFILGQFIQITVLSGPRDPVDQCYCTYRPPDRIPVSTWP